MDRASFLGSFAFGAAAAAFPAQALAGAGDGFGGAGMSSTFPGDILSGVRALSAERTFTLFRAGIEPAYRVAPGELVLIETVHGLPGLVTREGEFREVGPDDAVNPCTGPIFIEGVGPGDGLAIDFFDIRVGDWGYCGGRIYEFEGGYVLVEPNLRLPLRPMMGTVGIVPDEGEMDTRAPAETGGNMDCKEVRAGSTLVFTARVEGALVGMGDAHALQGDGEIRGQGIETDARVLARFRKLPRPISDRPVILRPEYVATLGALKDLNAAAWQATDDMVRLLADVTGRSREDARMLVNFLGDLRINQIVDPTKGARMELPTWVFGV